MTEVVDEKEELEESMSSSNSSRSSKDDEAFTSRLLEMNNKVEALKTVQNNFSILNEAPRTHYDSDQDIGNNPNNTSLLCDSRNPT